MAATTGPVAGFPLIDFKATLIDGAHHDVDSSTLAEIAAFSLQKVFNRQGLAF